MSLGEQCAPARWVCCEVAVRRGALLTLPLPSASTGGKALEYCTSAGPPRCRPPIPPLSDLLTRGKKRRR